MVGSILANMKVAAVILVILVILVEFETS